MDYPELDYFLNESLSDVVFIIDGQRIPALKQTLILKSRVFRAMFLGKFSESKEAEESKLPEIVVKETTFDAFKTLIRFLYSDELVFNEEYDWNHISDVYQLADRYDVQRLRQRVVQHLDLRLKVKHIQELVSNARIVFTNNIEELKPKVMSLIMKNIYYLNRKCMDELKELNDSTNDKLLDALTTKCMECKPRIRLTYRKSCLDYKIEIKDTSFEVLKTFIGFFYFGKLSLEDEEDFRRLREVCSLCRNDSKKPMLEVIDKHLKNSITVENLELITGFASDFKMDGILKNANSFKDTIETMNQLIGHSNYDFLIILKKQFKK